jgi:hypothetical protein
MLPGGRVMEHPPSDQPIVFDVVLGTVVELGGHHGVVWHATRDILRVLPIERGLTDVRLPLVNELAWHLPLSLSGWGVACDELIAWPRSACSVVGELDERCLLKVLDARRRETRLPSAAFADSVLTTAIHRATHTAH